MESTEGMESPTSASPSPPSPPLGEELAAVRTMEQAHQTDPILHHSQVCRLLDFNLLLLILFYVLFLGHFSRRTAE